MKDPRPQSNTDVSRIVTNNVRRIRKHLGWTLQRLSDELAAAGYRASFNVLSSQELGRVAQLSIDQAVALCQVFDVAMPALCDPAPCQTCNGFPPTGFSCNDCGARGKR